MLDLVLDTRLQAEDTNLTIPTTIGNTNTLSYNEAVPDNAFGSDEIKHNLGSTEDDNNSEGLDRCAYYNSENTLETLIKYSRIGFKLVPLGNDSNPTVSSTNEIYNNFDYWTEEKLTQNYLRFSNIATTFGVTHVQTAQGNKNDRLYLHCLDIDSDNVLAILFDLLNELKSKTFVTKTKKDCGYHVYWLSHIQHAPIGISRCRRGYGFEIKSDNSLGLCTLPSSVHRDDPSFRYTSVGSDDRIVVDDQLYDKLLGMLSIYINSAVTNIVNDNQKGSDRKNDVTKSSWCSSDAFRSLEEGTIEEVVSALKDIYQRGHRNSIVFGLSGLLFKSHVSLVSAQNIINRLCDCTNDEEKSSRLEVVNNTYLNGVDGREIKGTTQLLETLTAENEGDKDYAVSILENICGIVGIKIGNGKDHNNNNAIPRTAEILIQLTRDNTLFFKDQYNIAYAKIKVQEHNEIIALTSTKFEYFLRKLYYDYTQGKVAGQDAINNVIGVLIAQALFDGPTQVLHLRVAWGEDKNNKEIYYDLTDPKWQCIKISDKGWSIIQDPPVLFIRFNQQSQLEPERNYPQDIFDKFLDLMHITNHGHRLLTKVWIISLPIPDFPHPISITFGEKGGSKSTFCRFVKRLVDPDRIELLTIPEDKAEFVQQLYHNYLAVYDNIKQLLPWFSDEACKAVTGVGNSKRKFYTNDDDVIYKYKRSLMINGINNCLTEPDALDRSILTEFDRILPEQRREESKVEADFEEMRPKLLGYILDTVVKALQIISTIVLSNLPRMADFAVWGEAIARGMGYSPMEFVNAYNENIGKQNIEVLEANLLAQAIVKFVESWYDEGKKVCWEGSTKEALEQLNKIAQIHKIDTSAKAWPKAPNYLTRRLRPILSNLREGLGINIVICRQTTSSNGENSKRYVAFDFEWSQDTFSPLFAAAFVDSDGNTEVLHISDYSGSSNPEAELVKRINQQLLTYDFSIGWYSTGVARYHEDTQHYFLIDMVPELFFQAHFPRGPMDRLNHGYISGVYYEFIINSYNSKKMMGPKDLYIYTTGMSAGPQANVELLLAAKGSNLPEEKLVDDEFTPPVQYTRDGFYAIVRGGPFYMFGILPIVGHRYTTQMEYDDTSLTTFTLTDLTSGRREKWSTYILYWSDNLKSFGASEENHITRPCLDTECDNIDIQPWELGPYSITTTTVTARPRWKMNYISTGTCIPPYCYQNVNLNYVCINADKECNHRQQNRYSNRCFDSRGLEIRCPKWTKVSN